MNKEEEAYNLASGKTYDFLYFIAVFGYCIIDSMKEVSKVIELLLEAGYEQVIVKRFS
jgi:hypothetical protein